MQNPFSEDTQGTATHFSSWEGHSDGTTFWWTKGGYRVTTEYDPSANHLTMTITYNGEDIRSITEPLTVNSPTIEYITRETQRVVTNTLESW